MADTQYVWVVYSSYEYGGDAPEAVFPTKEQAKTYVQKNIDDDEDGETWLEIAKFDLSTGQQVSSTEVETDDLDEE